MKIVLIALTALAPSLALAHGSLVHQAAEAIDSAGTLFSASQPREVQRLVKVISATKTGHEMYDVQLALSNNTSFTYACRENEDVEPVRWECEAK